MYVRMTQPQPQKMRPIVLGGSVGRALAQATVTLYNYDACVFTEINLFGNISMYVYIHVHDVKLLPTLYV